MYAKRFQRPCSGYLFTKFQYCSSIMCRHKVLKPQIFGYLLMRPWKVGQVDRFRNSSDCPVMQMLPPSFMNLASLCVTIKIGQGQWYAKNSDGPMVRIFPQSFDIVAALRAKVRGNQILESMPRSSICERLCSLYSEYLPTKFQDSTSITYRDIVRKLHVWQTARKNRQN